MIGACEWNGGSNIKKFITYKLDKFVIDNPITTDKEVLNVLQDTIKSIVSEGTYEIQKGSELINLAQNLIDIIKDNGFLELPESLSDNFKLDIVGWFEQTPKVEDDQSKNASDDALLNDTYKEEYDEDNFLNEAYRGSPRAELLARNLGKKSLVESFILSGRTLVTSLNILNEAINKEQQRLLEVLCSYLRTLDPTRTIARANQNRTVKEETILNRINDPKIYKGPGKKSDFDLIKQYFKEVLKKPENLNLLVDAYINPNSEEAVERKAFLEAYNAYVLLDNFEDFVKELFGKVIEINEDVDRFAPDKYKITSKGTGLYTTWRTTEEIWLDKEVNSIALLLISSTPVYSKDSNAANPGKFLTFGQFTYTIGKIKLGMQHFPVLTEIDGFREAKSRVSESTKALMNSYTSLSEMLAKSRTNPLNYWKAIFDILAHSDVSQINKLFGEKIFNRSDEQVIYSIYKNLIGGENSLSSIIGNTEAKTAYNYYSNICQVADSLFNTKFIQYYEDDNGEIKIRMLQDQTTTRLKGALERKINNALSVSNYNDFKLLYSPVLNLNEDGSIKDVKFSIKGTDLKTGLPITINVSWNANTGIYSINKVDESGKSTIILTIARELKEGIELVKDILSLNIDSAEFKSAYNNIIIGINEADSRKIASSLDILALTLLSIVRNIISNEALVDNGVKLDSRSEILKRIDKLFKKPESRPTINAITRGLNVVDSKDVSFLILLAEIESYRLGLSTSSQLKDGNGNSMSTHTLSRLGDGYRHLWAIQNKILDEVDENTGKVIKKHSATKHFSILNNPAFLGLYQAKELKSRESNKGFEDMTNSEMITASFVEDFLALLGVENRGLIQNIIYLLPSVNSDKKFIGRLAVNLNEFSGYYLITLNTSEGLKIFLDKDPRGAMVEDGDTVLPLTWKDMVDKDPTFIYEVIQLEFLEYFIVAKLNINQDFTRISPFIQLQFSDLPILNRDNLEEWNAAVRAKGLVPSLVLNLITKEYNIQHPNHPIVFIDLVHFVNKGGDLTTNVTFDNLLKRFSDPNLTYLFFLERALSTVSSMLEENFEYTVDTKGSVAAIILKNSNGWLDSGKRLILAKVKVGNAVYNITGIHEAEALASKLEMPYTSFFNLVSENNLEVEINPKIESWVGLDYLFTEEWIASTVGHHYAHPSKKAKPWEVYFDEAERKKALNKRNVSYTATMQEFILGDLMGIPSVYNIAVIDDIKDTLYNVLGHIDGGVKPYDGATFVNPFIVYLENFSLGGSKAGQVKKLFVHYYDHRTGTGGIIKTAGFGLTNLWIADSPELEAMMKSMTNRVWRFEDDSLVDLETANITRGYDNNLIEYGTYFYRDNISGAFYKVDGLKYEGNYRYSATRTLVNPNTASPIPGGNVDTIYFDNVNTNYAVWNMFGGKNSYEFTEGKLVPSEASIEMTIKAMNNVGKRTKPGTTQSEVYLFMKHSDIHYIPTIGAVKLGAGNINSNAHYTSGEDLNTMRINMLLAGIQLDKEHEADGEEVSLMTLVISSCISRGYSFTKASKLYKALAAVAEYGLKDLLDALEAIMLKNPSQEALDRFKELVVDTIVESIAFELNPNKLVQTVAGKLLKAAREGKNIPFADKIYLIPYSDPGVYKQLASKLSVAITKAAIKIKVDGVLSMLCPSYGIMKLYGNKMYHEYLNRLELELALREQPLVYDDTDPNNMNLSKVQLGRTYIIENKEGIEYEVEVKTPLDYYNLKNNLANISSIRENITVGRDLGHYNCTFTARRLENGVSVGDAYLFLLFDLDSIRALYLLEQSLITLELDLKSTPELSELIQQQINETKRRINLARKLLLLDLNSIHNEGTVSINGIKQRVDSLDEVIPYELILPKFFATSFGLSKHDNLSEINAEFFLKKIQEVSAPKVEDSKYDLCLKRLNGKHVYIKHRNTSNEGLTYKKINKYSRDGKVWWTKDGEKVCELNSKNDKVYTYTAADGQVYEIIETDNIEHYLDVIDDVYGLYVSNESSIKTELLKSIQLNQSKVAQQFTKLFNDNSETVKSIEEFNELLKTGVNDAINPWKIEMQMKEALAIYSSFLKALDVVAARIPAQSMQSFMPMKIAGFDNTGSNTAFVSTALIWLLGSDYDIDSVTITRFATDRSGKFIHWSPLAEYGSYLLLRASDNLPFPTGKKIEETTDLLETLRVFSLGNIYDPSNLVYINEKGRYSLNTSSIENINKLIELIEYVNAYGLDKVSATYNGEELISGEAQEFIRKMIDKHNTSLFNKPDYVRENALKNFLLTEMYDVILDPRNLIQALTPIDTATDIVKKPISRDDLPAAIKLKTAVPGNPIVKINDIVENLVGKKGVGISAVGLKSYFAAFLRNSIVLNNPDSTEEELLRLILDTNGITIKGQTYYAIANSHISGTNPFLRISDELAEAIKQKLTDKVPLTKEELRGILTYVNNDVDCAVILSAILSLATDNAKELSLAKLNAGTKMLGMYIYGATIGMPFDAIAEIMMSPSAIRIALIMNGNLFTKNPDISIDAVFRMIINGPSAQISNYLKKDITGDFKPRKDAATWLTKNVLRTIGGIYFKEDSLENLLKTLNHATNVNPKAVYDKLNAILLSNNTSKEKKELIRIALDYTKTKLIIENDKENYDALVELSKGATELRKLGQLLHLNLGIATSVNEQLSYILLIEEAAGTSLEDFVNEPENSIKNYNKHTYNILDVINGTPHFRKYLEGVNLLDKELQEVSVKYRLLRLLGPKVASRNEGLNIIKSEDIEAMYGRLERMVNDYVMTEWMLDRNITFTIQEGQLYYDVSGDLHTAEAPITIRLGSFLGKASFKLWMEQTVIPHLKKGYNGRVFRNTLALNDFLKDLQINSYDKTPNHVNMNAYTLPANMSPRTDEERIVFDHYKDSFNRLSTADSKYYSGNTSYNIQDLFFLYNMVAFLNLPGEAYLKNIFEDIADRGYIGDFYKFESQFDIDSTLSINDLDWNYVLMWATPVGSVYGASSNWIFANEVDSFDKVLYQQADQDFDIEMEDFRGRRSSNGKIYIQSGYTSDSQHIGFDDSKLQPIGLTMTSSLWEGEASVSAVIDHGKVRLILVGRKRYELPNPISSVPYTFNPITKETVVDTERLFNIINDQLNKC